MNPTAEDMYEKARRAFFGTVETSPNPSPSSADPLKQQNKSPSKEVNGLSLDEYDAT